MWITLDMCHPTLRCFHWCVDLVDLVASAIIDLIREWFHQWKEEGGRRRGGTFSSSSAKRKAHHHHHWRRPTPSDRSLVNSSCSGSQIRGQLLRLSIAFRVPRCPPSHVLIEAQCGCRLWKQTSRSNHVLPPLAAPLLRMENVLHGPGFFYPNHLESRSMLMIHPIYVNPFLDMYIAFVYVTNSLRNYFFLSKYSLKSFYKTYR